VDIEDSQARATEIFRSLRVVDFNWSENYGAHEAYNQRGRWTGLLAQEMVGVVPYIINAPDKNCVACLAGLDCQEHVDEEGKPINWFVQYDHLVPMVVKGIQEMDARILDLEKGQAHFQNGWLKDQVRDAMNDSKFKDWLKAELV